MKWTISFSFCFAFALAARIAPAQVRISESQIGINVNTPQQAIDARGNNPDEAALLQLGNSDGSHQLLIFPGRTSDPNPFIRWINGDPLRFATDEGGFTELMRIESNGRLGLGTDAPTTRLDVRGTSRFDGNMRINGRLDLNRDINDISLFIGSASGSNDEGFNSNTFIGNQSGLLNTSGRVNTFVGHDSGRSNRGGSENTALGHKAGSLVNGNGNTFIGYRADGPSLNSPISNAIAIGHNATVDCSDCAVIGGSNTRLGIGTSSPAHPLHVVGNLLATGTATFGTTSLAQSQLELSMPINTTATENGIILNAANRRWRMTVGGDKSPSSAYFQLLYKNQDATEYTAHVTVNHSNGAVGIGTTNPQKKLHVAGELRVDNLPLFTSGVTVVADANGTLGRLFGAAVGTDETVENLKRQNEELRQKNQLLEARLDRLEAVVAKLADRTEMDIPTQTIPLPAAELQQNQPNPFHEATTVRYHIPTHIERAELLITDSNGRLIKRIDIPHRGEGQTTLEAATLNSGIYQYTLVLDGQYVESKKMVLTK